jgi:FkbM family methyltransferase
MRQLLVKGYTALPNHLRDYLSQLRWRNRAVNRLHALGAGAIRSCDLTIQEGAGQGLRFNAGTSAVSFVLGSSQRLVQDALRALLKEGMSFYDVGANVGFFTVIAARLLGRKARIVCFEPLPENCRQIRHNAALNRFENISIKTIALGKFDGEAAFWTSAEPTWGKLAGTGTLPAKMNGEIKVPVRRLDSIVAEDNLPPPDVIKIDVEGAEVDVVLGATGILERNRPALLIELHGTNQAAAETLSRLGYQTKVIGDSVPITQAHWNASIVAIPVDARWPTELVTGCLHEETVGTRA